MQKLNVDGQAQVYGLSCATTGNCTAGGVYEDGAAHMQAFVASEVKGTWRAAIEVPGSATLNVDGSAGVNRVSCAAGGTCAAGGFYADGSNHDEAFVVSQI